MDTDTAPKKIVIVEDNVSLADIYKTRLEIIGYKCFVAYDGVEALDMIQRELPNLVLLDLMIPKVAGDQVLERMRASDWGKDIKVYIISNLNEADAPAGLRDKGIVGYAVKANLSNDQLDQLVDNILKPAGQTEDVSSLEMKPTDSPTVTEVASQPVQPQIIPQQVVAQPQVPVEAVSQPIPQTVPSASPSTIPVQPATPANPQPTPINQSPAPAPDDTPGSHAQV